MIFLKKYSNGFVTLSISAIAHTGFNQNVGHYTSTSPKIQTKKIRFYIPLTLVNLSFLQIESPFKSSPVIIDDASFFFDSTFHLFLEC